jgi:hypothetical protein
MMRAGCDEGGRTTAAAAAERRMHGRREARYANTSAGGLAPTADRNRPPHPAKVLKLTGRESDADSGRGFAADVRRTTRWRTRDKLSRYLVDKTGRRCRQQSGAIAHGDAESASTKRAARMLPCRSQPDDRLVLRLPVVDVRRSNSIGYR